MQEGSHRSEAHQISPLARGLQRRASGAATERQGMSRPLLEFGGGSGDILRDLLHLRSVFEAEALISGAEGRD